MIIIAIAHTREIIQKEKEGEFIALIDNKID